MMVSRERVYFTGLDFHRGEEILIDKPFGWSSFKVVYEIRNAIGWLKIGHAGTLDPYATGLLILCTGKKTKSISDFRILKKLIPVLLLLVKPLRQWTLKQKICSRNPSAIFPKNRSIFLKKNLQEILCRCPLCILQ